MRNRRLSLSFSRVWTVNALLTYAMASLWSAVSSCRKSTPETWLHSSKQATQPGAALPVHEPFPIAENSEQNDSHQ